MLHWGRDKMAFAISGGGARGATQVGMLRALIEREITPDLIVGVSIGAWNGAWLAHRPELEWVKQLEEVWRQVTRRTLDMVWWRAARNMMRRKPSLYEGGGLSRFIARHLQVSNFEDLAVPLHTVAIDLTMGTKAVFSHGPLGPAVLASSAIPGVFPPVVIEGRQHVDGGMVDPERGLSLRLRGARRPAQAPPGSRTGADRGARLPLKRSVGRKGPYRETRKLKSKAFTDWVSWLTEM
jgi:NTE family protein